jgi:hypothetical protein
MAALHRKGQHKALTGFFFPLEQKSYTTDKRGSKLSTLVLRRPTLVGKGMVMDKKPSDTQYLKSPTTTEGIKISEKVPHPKPRDRGPA